MRVEVETPEEYAGSGIVDLNSSRVRLRSPDERGDAGVIVAIVPMANTFGC